jgi:hypothetical protein
MTFAKQGVVMPEQVETLEAMKAFEARQTLKGGEEPGGANLSDIHVSATYADAGGIIPGVASSADVAQQSLMPGQRITGKGTTVANPLRSDPRVEAILGEKKYHTKEPAVSQDKMRLEIEQLKNMVEILLRQQGKDAVAAEIRAEPPKFDDDFEEKSYQELKSLAKQLGLKVPVGITSEEIIGRLRKYKYAGSTV